MGSIIMKVNLFKNCEYRWNSIFNLDMLKNMSILMLQLAMLANGKPKTLIKQH